MPGVVVLVPRRVGVPERDRLWEFTLLHWDAIAPVVEGHHDGDEPFNRSRAVNRAAASAGAWEVAVVIDGDVIADPLSVEMACAYTAATGAPSLAYADRWHLTRQGTRKVLEGHTGSWRRLAAREPIRSCSGALVLRRDLWDTLGGFDEQFSGWGWEDVAMVIAAETLAGRRTARAGGELWHLWHPRSPERHQSAPTFAPNRERGERYKQARGDRRAIMGLVSEHLQARA